MTSPKHDRPESDAPSHPIVELTLARFREFWREPGAVFWAFGFPLLLALALGIAFRERPIPRPALALDHTPPSWLAPALTAIEAKGVCSVETMLPGEAERALRIGSVDVLVAAEAEGTLIYRFDPDREAAVRARLVVDDALQRELGREDVTAVVEQTETLPGARYVDFMFPGVIGMSLMSSAVWGIGYSIVLARKRGQLKRLAATPMRRSHFMLGTFLSRAIFLALKLCVLLTFGWAIFDIRVTGSPLALAAVAIAGSGAFAGIALTVAARVRSVESANGWLNFATLPMWMLSGVFFSYERFPDFAQLPIRLLPLTALNDGLRQVMNEGAGFAELGFELTNLALWSVATFAIASRSFRWQ
ncbi:MAG: ABC transporter permease [Planctomycetota bacterium]|jgi:ABC-type multidrug transport system permease subunit